MGCLGDDDVVRDATIRGRRDVTSGVFSESTRRLYHSIDQAETKFSAPLEIFQGAHRFAICI
jgi:hypothetical protein